LPNNKLQEIFSRRFRALLCGDPSGNPPWLETVASGEGRGLYLPDDAPWVVHADLGTLVGGVRALLMQALHPGSLAGTIRWLTITTFASHEALAAEASRVNRMHDRVKGQYESSSGESRNYRAADPDLLRWVHIAFMDSFLRSHQIFSTRPIPGGADAYVRLWSKSVEPLGLTDVPMNEAELLKWLDHYRGELAVNDDTRDVIQWLRNPPLPKSARPVYALLFQSALASLPAEHRKLIGLKSLPLSVLRPITTTLLKSIRLAIGPENPLEDVAKARLNRGGGF
jgi:uncharacterized protein (DUF2236 family)